MNSLFQQVNELIKQKTKIGTTPLSPYIGGPQISIVPGGASTDSGLQQVISNLQSDIVELRKKVDAMPNQIIDGLDVYAKGNNILAITAGKAKTKDGIVNLNVNKDLSIEQSDTVAQYIAVDNTLSGIFYLVLNGGNNPGINVKPSIQNDELILAKVIINQTSGAIYDDSDGTNNYIVSGKDLAFAAKFKIDDDTRLELGNLLDHLLAENIYGTITLSEGLTITNLQNSVQIDSMSLKVLNSGTKFAEFNKDGVYFFKSNGQTLAQYTKDGAIVGNIQVTPNSLNSLNFLSGNNGFIIRDNGHAEFNDIKIRGHVNALSGTIGRWTIGRKKLTDTNDTTGLAPDDYPFYSGASFTNRGTAPFRVNTAGKMWATGAVISGTITANYIVATSGYVGGWKIYNNKLSSTRTVLFGSGLIRTSYISATGGTIGGWTLGSTTISAGAGTTILTSTGKLSTKNISATNAIIRGRLSATTLWAQSGTVGGWTLDATNLTGVNASLGASGYIHMGTGSSVVYMDSNNLDYRLWIGNTVAANAPFRVTKSGTLYAENAILSGIINASSGYIAGFSVEANELSASNGRIIINSLSGAYYINGKTWEGQGIKLQYNGGNPRAYIGNGSNRYIEFTGTNLKWAGTNTSLTSGGTFTALNAVINGTLSAAIGTIGGWKLSATKLSGVNGNITMDSNSGLIKVGNSTNYLEIYGGASPYIKSSNFSVSPTNPKGFRLSSDGTIEAVDGIFKGKLEGSVFTKNQVNTVGGDLIMMTTTRTTSSITNVQTSVSLDSGVFIVDDLLKFGDGTNEVVRVTSIANPLAPTITRAYSGTNVAHNGKITILKVGVHGQTNKGYIELLGTNNVINIHNVSATGVYNDTIKAQLGLLTQGIHSGKYGLYASVAQISGNITASTLTTRSGTIGGWTISSNKLSGGVLQLYASGVIHSTNFNVSNTGIISATSARLKTATISGNITASTITARSGTIGGWTIGTSTISANTGTTILNASTGKISTKNISATNAIIRGRLSATTLWAQSGTIGGWTIGQTTISGGGGVTRLNATTGKISTTLLSATGGTIGGWSISSNRISAVNLKLYSSGRIFSNNFNVNSIGHISATSIRMVSATVTSNLYVSGTSYLSGVLNCEEKTGLAGALLYGETVSGNIHGVYVKNNTALAFVNDVGIRVYSWNTNSGITYNKTILSGSKFTRLASNVGEYNNYVYVPTISSAKTYIKILEINSSGLCNVCGSVQLSSTSIYLSEAYVYKNALYLGGLSSSRCYIYDLRNPISPTYTSYISSTHAAIHVHENNLIVASSVFSLGVNQYIKIYSIKTNPLNPTYLTKILVDNHASLIVPSCKMISYRNRYLYIHGRGFLYVVDMLTQTTLSETITGGDYITYPLGLSIIHDYLYIGGGAGLLYKIKNPTNIVSISTTYGSDYIQFYRDMSIGYSGQTLYVRRIDLGINAMRLYAGETYLQKLIVENSGKFSKIHSNQIFTNNIDSENVNISNELYVGTNTKITVSGFIGRLTVSGVITNKQVVKAWAMISATGVLYVKASYNVSSVTDNGVGKYAVNFTNALSNANYCVVTSKDSIGTVNSHCVIYVADALSGGSGTKTATSFPLTIGNPQNGTEYADSPNIYVVVLGN